MFNNCIFIGRLGADPVVKTTESGKKVAQFNMACDEPGYTKKDGTEVQKRTEWIPVVLWNGLAETAERYVKKGALVMVEGKFRTRSYEKEGITYYRSEIYADTMRMLESRKDAAPLPTDPDTAPQKEVIPAQAPAPDDDLPF